MPVNARVLEAGRRLDAMQKARMAAMSLGGQVQGRGVQVGPVGVQRAQRQQVDIVRSQNNQRYEAAKSAAGVGAKHDDAGGVKGLLGDVLGNAVVSTVLKPLGLLSYGLKGVVAGAEEARAHLPDVGGHLPDWLRGAFTLIDKPKAEADTRSVVARIKDPNYGYGSITKPTGGEWTDRFVGLTGDIALDPFTYLSGGLDKIPGATGRVGLAKEAFEKGLSEEVIQAAGRSGARGVRGIEDAAVREAAIEALKLPQPGLRFAGRETGLRIPLTGKIDEGIAAGLEKVRAPFTDRAFGRTVRMAGSARQPLTREAVESLVTRGGGKYSPAVAAGHLVTEDLAKGMSNYTGAKFENLVEDIAKRAKDDAAVTHAVEAGDFTGKAAAQWKDLSEKVLQAQRDAGVSIGEMGNEELGGYVGHVLNKKGRQAFGHATSNVGGAEALLHPESSQFARAIKPGGKYTIMGKVYEPVTASIKEGNEWAVKNLGYKIYEDSPSKLTAQLLKQAQGAVKDATKINELAKAGINQQVFSKIDPRVTTIDEALTRAASKEAGQDLADRLEPLLAQVSDAEGVGARTGAAVDEAGQALQAYDTAAMSAQRRAYGEGYGKANEAQAAFDQAAAAAPDVSGQLEPLQARLSEAQAAEAAAQRPVDELTKLATSGLQGPKMTSPVAQAHIDRLEAQFQQFADIARAAPTERAQRQAILRAKATQDQLNDVMRRFALPVEGAPLPEAEPFQEALQQASGARQGLEQQVGPLQAQQAAHEALGPPPNTDQIVADHVAPVLEQLAAGRQGLTQYRYATQMSDIAAQAGNGATRAQVEAEIAKLPEHAQAMMRRTMAADRSPEAMGSMLNDIRQGKLDDQIIRQANVGYEQMNTDRLIGRDVIINSEMRQAMEDSKQAMERFNAAYAKERHLVSKVIDEFTKSFKAWSLATPGQHMRNGMSATFMNMSDGVLPSEMLDGVQIIKAFRKNPSGDWVADLAKTHPDLAPVAEDVVKAVYASGAGGQYTAAEIGTRAFGEEAPEGRSLLNKAWHLSYENRITKASHNVGERWVEGPVRAGVAMSAIGKDGSGSWVEAVTRIRRIHFDYSEVNELDRGLRRVIPFWTFMSRNLPLQVQQMWTAPRAYLQYQSVMRNMNADPEGNQAMPSWLADTGAVFLNDKGLALAPDIGPSQVTNYLNQIADPKQLLQNLTPPLKSAIELATNHDIYYDQTYKKNDYIKPGWELTPLMPVLSMLGMTKNTAQGPVILKKHNEAIRDNIPVLAQLNRLFSTTSDREGKGRTSQLSYAGVPVRQVNTEGEERSRAYDARQRGFDERNLRDAMAKFGGAA